MKDEIISFPRTGMRLWQIAKKIRPQKKIHSRKRRKFSRVSTHNALANRNSGIQEFYPIQF